jgi:peptide/nickel transport system permease protein
MLTALVILTLMGAGFWPLTLAVAIPQVAPIARITYQATRTAYILPYIEAARGLGATPLGILWRHITRAVAPAVIAYIGVVFGYTLLLGSGLAFLGLGWPLGTPEWGIMLAEGRVGFRTAPWVSLPPGIAITGLIWLVNDTCQRFAQGL